MKIIIRGCTELKTAQPTLLVHYLALVGFHVLRLISIVLRGPHPGEPLRLLPLPLPLL